MKNDLDCEVIEDLLPSYIDQLTHDKTNQLIEEHLQNCFSCRKKYEEMSLEDDCSSLEEIDYLKKIRKQNKKSFFKGFLSVLIVISLALVYVALIGGWKLNDVEIEGLGMNYLMDEDGTETYSYQGKINDDLSFKRYAINDHDIVIYGGYSLISRGDDRKEFTINIPVKDELQYFYLYDELIIVLGDESEETAHKIYTLAQASLGDHYFPTDMINYLTAFLQLTSHFDVKQHIYDDQYQLIFRFDEPCSSDIYDFIAQTYFMFSDNTEEIIFEDTAGTNHCYRREDYSEIINQDVSYEDYQKFYDQYFPSS